MLKIAIATDGPYGERAFENIKKGFDTEFIELEKPTSMFMDEIDIPEYALSKIKESNILIAYTQHPDLTLNLVDMVSKDVDYIIVAAWRGEGFKNQLERHGNVTCPYIMCELEENGNKVFDEFTSKIGKPKVDIKLENGQVVDINVVRSSPCGSTSFVADYISDKYLNKSNLDDISTEAGLKLQHYPCRAAKMRLFSDEECKKEMASGFHKDAFEIALKESREDNDCECECDEEYKNRPEEDISCGCECENTEYPNESLLNNPDESKVIADDKFIQEFENYSHSLGIKSIGYALLTPDLLIKDKFIQYPNAIVLTMEIDKEIIETAPGAKSQKLNDSLYEKFGNLTYKLSDYLRENGFATEVAHPCDSIVNFSPLAQKAGLGYMGKNGLLITPELGPRQKISAIFASIANLSMEKDNEHSWIPDYCDKCGKCVKACPEEALIQKETCCGDKEIEFIQKLCIGCSQGCTYCIKACPFDEKGYEHIKNKFDKMTAKLMEKSENKCC